MYKNLYRNYYTIKTICKATNVRKKIGEMRRKMIVQKDHFHGSDFEKIEELFGVKQEDIISFSANVNPLGLSPLLKKSLAKQMDVLCRYPDREYTALRTTIATYCDTTLASIFVGNGSTELISLIISLIKPKKAIIFAPTYSEYEHEVTLSGGESIYFPMDEANEFSYDSSCLYPMLTEEMDMLILCNPNNPTGNTIGISDLDALLHVCDEKNIFVMIDETYMEFVINYKNITAVSLTKKYQNLAIIRGISKFFACPGLRLGYTITTNKELLSNCKEKQNAWSINSLAEVAGRVMFTDTAYISATQTLINTERDRVINILKRIPTLHVFPATANFCLIKILCPNITASTVFEIAIRQGLMIRDCSSFSYLDSSFFRICFMRKKDNNRLLKVLQDLFNS